MFRFRDRLAGYVGLSVVFGCWGALIAAMQIMINSAFVGLRKFILVTEVIFILFVVIVFLVVVVVLFVTVY